MRSGPKAVDGPVIVSAPQGSGKTKLAAELCAAFGCKQIVDEWDGKQPLPAGTLVLTNRPWPKAG